MKSRAKAIIAIVLVLGIAISLAVYLGVNNQESMKNSIGGGSSSEESKSAPGELQDSAKIITNVFMSIETLEFESSVQSLNKAIAEHKGFIENSNIGYNSYIENKAFKSGDFTIRVPHADLKAFTEKLKQLGNLVSQTTSKLDVIKQYQDTEGKLNLLKVKEQRLISLLENAVNMADIIAIENELSNVIQQKEEITNQIKELENQVSYSTVLVNLLEVERYSTTETPDAGFWKQVLEAFKNSLYVFRLAIEKFVFALIYMLPFAAVVGAGYLVFRKFRRK